jgi:hypothetical protein
VLTKTDLVPDCATCSAQLRVLNPDAPLWRAAGAADRMQRPCSMTVPARRCGPFPSQRSSSRRVHAFALSFDGALDWTMFGVWLTMLLIATARRCCA